MGQRVKVKEHLDYCECVSGFVVVMINAEGQGPRVGTKANLHKKDNNHNGSTTMYHYE